MAEEITCAVENEEYRSACRDLPKYPGSRYCVLHEPDESKNKEAFEEVQKSKLAQKDYDFGGAVFPEGTSDFRGVHFDEPANFGGTTFVGVADFSVALFSGELTDFSDAQFNGPLTSFSEALFRGMRTSFTRAQFNGMTDFSNAEFKGLLTYFPKSQFSGVQTSFSGAQFNGADGANFREAQFCGKRTSFEGAQFRSRGAFFSGAQFSGERASFVSAQFHGAVTSFVLTQFSSELTVFSETRFSSELTVFSETQFSGALTDFSDAQFSGAETSFREVTIMQEVYFTGATFKENASFRGSVANRVFSSGAWFDHTQIEKPERFAFHTVLLHPGWFVNVDVRKVGFTDVKWYGMPGGIEEGTLEEEIAALTERGVESPHALLSQACQRLSANAEENREYPLANEFQYWSQNALRKESWRSFGLIRTLYWALSGYGVRARRAFFVLLGIWAAFTLLYLLVPSSPFSEFSVSDFGEATVYSLGAIARLNPEPKPDPGWFQFLVTVEGLLGPLQIALLLLAIRRKVMR